MGATTRDEIGELVQHMREQAETDDTFCRGLLREACTVVEAAMAGSGHRVAAADVMTTFQWALGVVESSPLRWSLFTEDEAEGDNDEETWPGGTPVFETMAYLLRRLKREQDEAEAPVPEASS